MIPRLDISFPLNRQRQYWLGDEYIPAEGEYLLNHARTGIVIALRVSLPYGGKVGVVAYNCHTVANAVIKANCTPVFLDVTETLQIDVTKLSKNLDAIVVTNLFGIRNDIKAIKNQCPNAVVIVDNAHGYGLPAEGDFTVYSINQGKFPSLGEGGILKICGEKWKEENKIDELYAQLSTYNIIEQFKLFLQMQVKAAAYLGCLYWLTMKMKKNSNPKIHQEVVMRKMAPGIKRIYNAVLSNTQNCIQERRENAQHIAQRLQTNENVEELFWGENAFMVVARCKNPQLLQEEFQQHGIETATHFVHAIDWAESFGYKRGACSQAESLTKHLIMIPTYCKIY